MHSTVAPEAQSTLINVIIICFDCVTVDLSCVREENNVQACCDSRWDMRAILYVPPIMDWTGLQWKYSWNAWSGSEMKLCSGHAGTPANVQKPNFLPRACCRFWRPFGFFFYTSFLIAYRQQIKSKFDQLGNDQVTRTNGWWLYI